MSVLLDLDDSQLVLLDFQTRLVENMLDASVVVSNALRLARMASLLHVPLFASEHNPSQSGVYVPDLSDALVQAQVGIVRRMQFSAVQEGLVESLRPPVQSPPGNARSLPKHLQKKPIELVLRSSVVLAGCQIHVGLLQTALELLEEDFHVWVVTDACGASTERNRDAALDRLAGAGGELLTTEMVAYEWLRSAEHPAFKEIQVFIK